MKIQLIFRVNVRREPRNPKEIAEKYDKKWISKYLKQKQKCWTITRQMHFVAVLTDAIVTFQWIGRLQGESWLSSTSPPSLTSPPASPTQPTWCAPTFSTWFDLQDSHDGSFALTCPAFFLWLRWSSSRGLQVIAIQRTKQFDNFHYILIPFRPFFPSIRLYILLNDQSSFQASSCIV